MFYLDMKAGKIKNTHRPANKEHGNGSDKWHISDQRLQDHTQLPVELQEKVQLRAGSKSFSIIIIILKSVVPGLLSRRLCRNTS